MSYVMFQGANFKPEDDTDAEQSRIKLKKEELATRAQNKARYYLKEKKVFPLLSFMAGHLLTQEPEDPVLFLLDLTRRLIDFRDMGAVAPLLFTGPHLESLCVSLAGPHGGLTDQQFHRGMSTLAICGYDLPENRDQHGLIEHADFIAAAQLALKEHLMEMLQTTRKVML